MKYIGKAIATLGICGLAVFAVNSHPGTVIAAFPFVLLGLLVIWGLD